MRRLAALAVLAASACSTGGKGSVGPPTSTSTAGRQAVVAASASTTIDPTAKPAPPASAAAAARDIARTELAVRDPSVTGAALALAAHQQQVAYRAWAVRPAWDNEVLTRVPLSLRGAATANMTAARRLRQLVRTPRSVMPAWRIVAPKPADELRRDYEEGERAFGIPWQYLAAVNLTETKMGRLRGTSNAGAQGPMQFLPSTWARYGRGDVQSDHDSILAAARYLAANGGKRGNMSGALHHYNPTATYVDAVKLYAEQMIADERAYRGYYNWQVYYLTTLGDAWLRVGYSATTSRPVTPADLR
ncbi:MAG: lytic transglycosylase domain-containing protein [Acidobacteria bacterium]|nr:lytic transglycosylase domain-containing protein [Acidobacteriota bacterium]